MEKGLKFQIIISKKNLIMSFFLIFSACAPKQTFVPEPEATIKLDHILALKKDLPDFINSTQGVHSSTLASYFPHIDETILVHYFNKIKDLKLTKDYGSEVLVGFQRSEERRVGKG